MSRVAWGLTSVQAGAKPDPNGPRKLQVIKSNLARHPEPLGVVLEPLAGGEYVRVVYSREHQSRTRSPRSGMRRLIEYLEAAGKPVAPKVVIAAAVFRAREALRQEIVNTDGRRSPVNCWRLASEDAAERESTHSAQSE